MGQLEELFAHRQSVESNIEKSFGTGFDLNDEFEKARSGVYADNAENRRLKRVGQKYGSSAAPEQGGAAPQGKKAEEGGQKPEGKVDSGKLANYASGASDEALKRAAADENAAPEVKAAAQAELKKRGGGEEGGSDKGAEKHSGKPVDNSRTNSLKIDNSTFKQSTPEVKRSFNGILKDLYNEKFQGKDGLFDDLMWEIDPENGDVEQFVDLSQGEADKQIDELMRKKISPKKLFSLYDNYLMEKWGGEKVRELPTPNAKKRMREMTTWLAENSDYALRTDILNNHKSDSWMENHWDDDPKKLAAAALACGTVDEIVSLYRDENPDDDEENA